MELRVLSKFHLELLGCYKKLYNKEVEPLVGLPGGIYLFLIILVFTNKNHEKINIYFLLYFSVRKKMMQKMTRTNGMIRKYLANVTQYREKYLTQPLPKKTEISRNNELLSFQNIDFKTIYIEAKYLLT